MMSVEDRLKMMFVENTGGNLIDSGGIYGRRYDYNQKHHPCDAPEVEFDGDCVFVNAYKHLLDILDTDELCDRFNALNEGCEDLLDHEFYSDKMDEVATPARFTRQAYDLLEERLIKVKRHYYTYNYDCILDHDMIVSEIVAMDDDGYEEAYVLISLHLGCDARWGFGTAYLFKESHWTEFNVSPSVWGTVKRGDEEFEVSNDYNGVTLKTEDEEDYEFQEGDEVSLSVSH